MSAQLSNELHTNMTEQVSHKHEAKTIHFMSGEASLSMMKEKTLFTSEQRAQFYTGEDRMMLPSDQLSRLYDLEKQNDQLQREIFYNERSINGMKDPFAALANVEHAKMTIARNTGEILKIFHMTYYKLERIAELEKQNHAMHQENQEKQSIWTTMHDMNERTQIASQIFMNKDHIVRNEVEIAMLKQEASC